MAELSFSMHRNLPDPHGPADVAGKVVIQTGPGCPHETEKWRQTTILTLLAFPLHLLPQD